MAEMSPELFSEIETLEQKHAEHPQGRYFVPLANAYRKAGRVEQAETLVREGLRHHPDYLSAHIVLGRCLRDRGAADEAEATFRRVLDTDSQNLVALRSLGELAADGGRPDEARMWLERLVAVDPLNEEARALLEQIEADRAAGSEVEVAAGDGFGVPGGDEALAEQEAEPVEDRVEEAPAMASPEEELVLDAGPGNELEQAPPAGLDTFETTEVEADLPIELEADLEVAPDRSEAETESAGADAEDLGLITFDGPVDVDDASLSGGAATDEDASEVGGSVGGDAGEGWDEPVDLDLEIDTGTDLEEAHGETDDSELATRTMADLYARQGFHDRAAEVYRRLLREGGEDPELRQRLEECEAALAAGDEAEEADPFADSFAEGFVPTGAAAVESDETDSDDPHELDIDALERAFGEEDAGEPELGVEMPVEASSVEEEVAPDRGDEAPETAADGGGETIRTYLSRLARWSPETAPERQEVPGKHAAPPAAEAAAAGLPVESPEPGDHAGEEPAPWDAAPRPDEPVSEEATDDGPLPWEEPAEGGAPELEPWEEPAALDGQAADASAPGPDGDPRGALPEDEVPAAEPAADEEALPFERYFAEEETEPAAPAEESEEGPASGGRDDAGQDDDDLESFQAWLQSLKT